MTGPLDAIIAAAKTDPRRIIMPEGEDSRIIIGSLRAVRDGLARITLIGDKDAVSRKVTKQGGRPDEFDIVDPAASTLSDGLAKAYHQLRQHKGVDAGMAAAAMRQPLEFAAMMVREGHGDGTIGGAVATTADTVRVALQVIGRAAGAKLVSSFFVMILDQPHHNNRGATVFADCALIIDPTSTEMAEIACTSAHSFQALIKQTPKVAMLSFSTQGSGKHERVSKVAEATELVRAQEPGLIVGGELQFDAAFVPAIARSKSPGSPLEGDANVFIFPSLEAGNIAYKVAQRIGGAKAIGPILQGLAKPANDLSRGCSADDVYHMIAVSVVQAQNQ